MRKLIFKSLVATVVAVCAFRSWAESPQYDPNDMPPWNIEAGGSSTIGNSGYGPRNYNNDNSITTFAGDGTLYMINSTNGAGAAAYSGGSIWGSIIAKNGKLTVDPRNEAKALTIQRNFVAGQNADQTVDFYPSKAGSYSIGLSSSGASSDQLYLFDVPYMRFLDKNGNAISQNGQIAIEAMAVKGFPQTGADVETGKDFTAKIYVLKGDLLNVMGMDFTNYSMKWMEILDPGYIPATATAITLGKCNKLVLKKAGYTQASDKNRIIPQSATAYGSWGDETRDIAIGSNTLSVCQSGDMTFSGAVTSAGGTIELYSYNHQTKTIPAYAFASVSGDLTFVSLTQQKSPVTINAVGAGSRILNKANGSEISFGTGVTTPMTFTTSGGTWYVFPDAQGHYNFAGIQEVSVTAVTAVPTDLTYDDPAQLGNLKVQPAAGTTLTATLNNSATPTFVGGAGVVALKTEDVRQRAKLWIDFSKASTVYQRPQATPQMYIERSKTPDSGCYSVDKLATTRDGQPILEAAADVRASQTAYFLRNTRHYDRMRWSPSKNGFDNLPTTFATLAEGGPNGLSYMNGGARSSCRRIHMNGGTLDTQSEIEPPQSCNLTGIKRVIMVFSPDKGGCDAVLGLTQDALDRRGTGTEIGKMMAAKDIPVWVNGGARASASEVPLAAGWQIATLDISGYDVYGLGMNGSSFAYATSGGVSYGEVLFFEDELTDAERVSVEKKLAAKWGIAAYSAGGVLDALGSATAYGSSGAINVTEGRVALNGLYAGNLNVASGATLTVPSKYAPTLPTASEGTTYHFDPSESTSLRLASADSAEGKTDAIYALCPAGTTLTSMEDDTLFIYGVGLRKPHIEAHTSGIAPTRDWITFDDGVVCMTGTGHGNTLRFKNWKKAMGIDHSNYYNNKSDDKGDGTDKQISVRTVIIANDSFRGGGDPFLQSVSAGGAWGFRDVKDKTVQAALAVPIWSGAATAVTKGTTRLNGTQVDGTTTGFTGGPEVLSVVTKDSSVSLGNFGYYGNTEQRSGWGEMIGEVLAYTTALTTEQVQQAEEYLAYKWLGLVPTGCGDLTGATVDGAGDVVAGDAADLPQFASTFAGTVTAGGETTVREVSIAGTAVTGGLVAPDATFTLPASGTLNVTFTEAPTKSVTARTIELVNVKGVTSAVTWQVNVTGLDANRRYTIVTDRNGAYVAIVLKPSGLIIQYQ